MCSVSLLFLFLLRLLYCVQCIRLSILHCQAWLRVNESDYEPSSLGVLILRDEHYNIVEF